MTEYTKKCSKCEKILSYKNRNNYLSAVKRDSMCMKCVSQYRKKSPNKGTTGYKLSDEQKLKISERNKGKKRSLEFRQKRIDYTKGTNNPMYGISIYEKWVKKYGIDEANIRQKEWKNKLSIASSGENNNMYGKPCPDYIGSKGGSGWKGYYKNTRFLSLREAVYLITLDEQGISWTTAEHLKIPYLGEKGQKRTYTPDFIVENTIIEIKPVNRQKSIKNQAKWEALQKWSKENNYKCQMIDIKLDDSKIIRWYQDGLFQFDDKSLEQFKKYYKI